MVVLAALAIGLALYSVAYEDGRSGRSMLGAWLHSCNIRGNISLRTGERIYHVPGQTYYADTVISRVGERWFCSEAEARAAGWRRAKL